MQENISQLSSTNYFTRAMELTHMYIPGVTQQERLEAEQYLMTLRDTADGLCLSFHIINNEPVHDLRCFWAFNTIMHHLPYLARTVTDTQAEELYRVLFLFIYRYFFSSTVQRQTTDFLANKHAQIMVVGLQEFFPSRWRSFFKDIFQLFALRETLPHVSDAVTVYLLRLFEYIDERVVSVRERVDRCRELRARDMELKDTMREHVIPRAVATWYVILCECRVRAPEIANICLRVLQTYIEWIDIALFMTGEWINLLYFFLTVPSLRSAACECIFSLVEKKQLPAVKFESLCALDIVDALPRIMGLLQVPPITDEDLNFLEVVARLTRAVAEQYFALYEHLSAAAEIMGGVSNNNNNSSNNNNNNSSSSSTSIDISNNKPRVYYHEVGSNDKNTSGSGDVVVFFGRFCNNSPGNNNNNNNSKNGNHFVHKNIQSCGKEGSLIRLEDGCLSCDLLKDVCLALDTIFIYLLRLLGINDNDVSSIIFPFVQMYAKSTALREEQATQLLLTLYEHTRIFDLVEDEDKIWLEDIINKRKQSYNLIRLIFARYPSIVYQHLKAVISHIATTTEKEKEEQTALGCHSGTIKRHGHCEYQQGQECAENVGCGVNKCSTVVINADEIEAALRYLYEIGESFRMDKLKVMGDEFLELLVAVLSSEHIACCQCAVVHLSYFEVLDRHHVFFIYHKEYIPLMLQRFLLSHNGVTNGHHRVRARICYLFGHMAQLLKRQLLPHKESIVNALHAIFSSNLLLPCDLCELYEAVGSIFSVAFVSSKATDDQAVITQITESVVQCLRQVSSLSPSPSFSSTALAHRDTLHAVGYSASSEAVADTISFLSALAKGLRGTGSSSNGGNGNYNGTGGNGFFFADGILAEKFHNITRDVIDVFCAWYLSPCVRERAAQYFTQMVHILPLESMEVYFPTYLTNWLAWMETIPELTKLLRLLQQFINRGGSRVAAVLSNVLPLVMRKVASVGELSVQTDDGGVVSENTREGREAHRQLFSVLYCAVQAGCVAVVMSLPPSELTILLSRLLESINLPSETELPKLALQIMTKVTTTDWESSVFAQWGGGDGNKSSGICGCSGDVANNSSFHYGGNKVVTDSQRRLGDADGATSNAGINTAATTAVNSNINDCGCADTSTARWFMFILQYVIPAIFVRFTLPTFDLKDAKNFFLIGEAGLLLKALMDRMGHNNSLLCEVLYTMIQPVVGEEEVAGFVVALQKEQRFSAQMKNKFCYILQRAKERNM